MRRSSKPIAILATTAALVGGAVAHAAAGPGVVESVDGAAGVAVPVDGAVVVAAGSAAVEPAPSEPVAAWATAPPTSAAVVARMAIGLLERLMVFSFTSSAWWSTAPSQPAACKTTATAA